MKNAGIKSKTEAAQRLINGEAFYWGWVEIRFDPAHAHPFRWGTQELISGWSYPEAWQVPSQWYENLGEGVLCWVWDGNEDTRQCVGVVTCYEPEANFEFRLKSGVGYEHAQPVTAEEMQKFLWGG